MKSDVFIRKFIIDIENKCVPKSLTKLVQKITVEAHYRERAVSDLKLSDYRKILNIGELTVLIKQYQTKPEEQTTLNL